MYKTLVSEIMLQQTTVATVLNHFDKFLKKYPTIEILAKASEEDVCIAWKGLGYYRRAKNLRNIAIQIMDKHFGEIPPSQEELLKLKGIGIYTANAIVAIGADERGLAVDANLERVLARFYGYKTIKGLKLQRHLLDDFEKNKIMKEVMILGARNINEGLMDLGRVLCQARKVNCLLCPLKKKCKACLEGNPLLYPIENKIEKKATLSLKLLRVVVKEKSKYLFYQKEANEWLSGQWELPTFVIDSEDEKFSQYPRLTIKRKYNPKNQFKTGITKYSIENYFMELSLDEFKMLTKNVSKQYVFKTPGESMNLSTASIKCLKLI